MNLNKVYLKQKVLRILRNAKLLSLFEKFFYSLNILRTISDNRIFSKENPGFRKPPYKLMNDAFFHTSYRRYHNSGLEHAKLLDEIIKSYSSNPDLVVCEWGCGPARIIQHISELNNGYKVIGADYNIETIRWCKSAFVHITFIETQLPPPMDLPDNSIDVLYNISVFTHLSEEQHYDWINEIKRVLKTGGFLICSVHGENYKFKLLPDEIEKYDRGELVCRSKVLEGSRLYSSFQSEKFIRNKLLKGFVDIQKLEDSKSFAQTIWMARLGND